MIEVRKNDVIRCGVRGAATSTVRFGFNYTPNEMPGELIPRPKALTRKVEDGDGDRTVTTEDLKITRDGRITSARTQTLIGQPITPGVVFGSAVLIRGGVAVGVIMQGDIYGLHDLTYPQTEGRTENGLGRPVDNEAASTLVNNTALTRTLTVPLATRWILHGGHVFNADDVARTLTVVADNGTSGQHLDLWLADSINATTRAYYPFAPAGSTRSHFMPFPLSAGDRILITFAAGGASAGGTARSSAVVEEYLVMV